MKKYFILLTFLIAGAGLKAQDNVWTLQECIDYALENNLNLKRAELTLSGNEVGLKQSKYDLLPNLNGNASYGYNWGRSIDPTTNQFITQRINFTSLGAQSSVTIFAGGQLLNTVRQNEQEVAAAGFDVEAAKIDLMFTVISLYTAVVFNQELVENARAQLSSTEQQLMRVTKQVEAGALPKADQLDLGAQHSTNELNLINQQNSLDISILQLKQALQLPADTELQVVVPEELDAMTMQNEPVLEYSPAEIYEKAQQTLPEFKSAKARIESSELGLKIAKGGLFPSINASAGLRSNYSDAFMRFTSDGTFTEETITGLRTTNNEGIIQLVPNGSRATVSFSDQIEENLSKFLSFGLNVPIFNGWATRAGIQRAIISQQQAEINLQETRNVVRQDIERAYTDVQAAAKSYLASSKQVEAREEAFRMTKTRYDLGATTFIDYQLSENMLFQARSDMLRAKYDYIFKTKLLDFYLGNPLDF